GVGFEDRAAPGQLGGLAAPAACPSPADAPHPARQPPTALACTSATEPPGKCSPVGPRRHRDTGGRVDSTVCFEWAVAPEPRRQRIAAAYRPSERRSCALPGSAPFARPWRVPGRHERMSRHTLLATLPLCCGGWRTACGFPPSRPGTRRYGCSGSS